MPASFSRKYLNISRWIKLLDAAGKQWPVSCRYHNQLRTVKLTKGWIDFVGEKNLKTGDVCLFEFIQSEGSCDEGVHT